MDWRLYTSTDCEDALGLWNEAGWAQDRTHALEAADVLYSMGQTWVMDAQGSGLAALVSTIPGTIQHGIAQVPLSIVRSVLVSRRYRRRGLALRGTAQALATAYAAGAQTSILGIFDQGFYDRLGYGTGPAHILWRIDPGFLRAPVPAAVPELLTLDDYEAVHRLRLRWANAHGQVVIPDPRATLTSLQMTLPGAMYGWWNADHTELTHAIALTPNASMWGPVRVRFLFFETPAQFRELLGFLAGLGDQLRAIDLPGLAKIQWQDYVELPFARLRMGEGAALDTAPGALAYWQLRLLDLPGALASTSFHGPEIRFVFDCTDPIERYLPADSSWRGCGGTWRVSLGQQSHAEAGDDTTLPRLTGSINGFSRLWIGARSASALELTGELSGQPDLLAALDACCLTPVPNPGWEF